MPVDKAVPGQHDPPASEPSASDPARTLEPVTDEMLAFPWEDDLAPAAPPPPPPPPHLTRIVAHSSDRVAWLRARSFGITATDVARLATDASLQAVAIEKLHGSGFGGNRYTDHGREREPEIARWVEAEHGIVPSAHLFHAEGQRRHLATPDGVGLRADGRLELAEIKTTAKPWRSVPRNYLRQIWWQQYVLGAERSLIVWEQHVDFVPVHDIPKWKWIDRDEAEIAALVARANDLIALIVRMANAPAGARGLA